MLYSIVLVLKTGMSASSEDVLTLQVLFLPVQQSLFWKQPGRTWGGRRRRREESSRRGIISTSGRVPVTGRRRTRRRRRRTSIQMRMSVVWGDLSPDSEVTTTSGNNWRKPLLFPRTTLSKKGKNIRLRGGSQISWSEYVGIISGDGRLGPVLLPYNTRVGGIAFLPLDEGDSLR